MILGLLVTRDEGFFLVIVIILAIFLDPREMTSPFTTATDTDGYNTINTMDPKARA